MTTAVDHDEPASGMTDRASQHMRTKYKPKKTAESLQKMGHLQKKKNK